MEERQLDPAALSSSDFFGSAVATDGDWIAVGARGDDGAGAGRGALYLFERAGTEWTPGPKFLPGDPAATRQLGRSAAVSGTTVVAGASDDFQAVQGQVYVFERPGPVWVETAQLAASDGMPLDRFGWSVDTDGETIVVGAIGDATLGTSAGAAYVFERTQTGWVEAHKLLASDGTNGSIFGVRVAIDGERIAVAAQRHNGGAFLSGVAYVFERTAGGWVETQKLTTADASVANELGHGLSISGDRIALGATGDDDRGLDAGAVYLFEHHGDEWVQRDKVYAGDAVDEMHFGWVVDLEGDVMAVGSQAGDPGPNAGAVYVFERQAPFWYELQKLVASGTQAGDALGGDVALHGDRVVAGAQRRDSAAPDAGAAFVFTSVLGPVASYCETAPNSVGPGARIAWAGSTSLAAGDLTLVVHGAVPSQPGIFYYGGEAAELPFGDGVRCVTNGAGPVFRLQPTLLPDFLGDAFLPLDTTLPPMDAGAGEITAGSTWFFQFYYRDPAGPGGSGFNFSDGLQVTFCR